MSDPVVIDHPLVAHKLSLMRDKTTPSAQFRTLLREISLLLGYEVLRDLPTELRDIETPVGPTQAPFIRGKKLVLVPILRAGNGLLDGLLDLMPSARVGHVGVYRDPATLAAVEYYCKLPEDIAERLAIVLDPMLATGNSAVAAVSRLKDRGARDIRLVCLLAAPEGIAALARRTPKSASSPPPSTRASTTTATSCPASATPATACTARSDELPHGRGSPCRHAAASDTTLGAFAARLACAIPSARSASSTSASAIAFVSAACSALAESRVSSTPARAPGGSALLMKSMVMTS